MELAARSSAVATRSKSRAPIENVEELKAIVDRALTKLGRT